MDLSVGSGPNDDAGRLAVDFGRVVGVDLS